ncbi:MAG: bifunctional (p)ppGpp synthetase/guanosine-3',5'-bis(diphosphate) 3'-pyrophosphohydrolase [Chloracidobacterium sp.]|nr:bifunctional (p)ppGpp synthetase/guanosine-3',5'-bis(diphosphate) 3'-pyrophosphohydrolase [Chloracidobacterium sp.]MCO5334387.1 HD domain-containing protein [Pyrinomonadaceae bacterium]
MNNSKRILEAASFAAKKHTAQRRKGPDGEPYINHPLEVASFLANIAEIDDEDILIAALLHDTIEDCGVKAEEIAENFGDAVASYVSEVSDDRSLPKARRKELQIEKAPKLSRGAKLIKLADKISNINDVIGSPGIGWDLERRQAYVVWAMKVVAGFRGVNPALERAFDRIVERASVELGQEFSPSAQASPPE